MCPSAPAPLAISGRCAQQHSSSNSMMNDNDQTISRYTRAQAIEDGVLVGLHQPGHHLRWPERACSGKWSDRCRSSLSWRMNAAERSDPRLPVALGRSGTYREISDSSSGAGKDTYESNPLALFCREFLFLFHDFFHQIGDWAVQPHGQAHNLSDGCAGHSAALKLADEPHAQA